GQSFNVGVIDLNLLKGYFLDWRNCGDLGAVRRMIELNSAARGWLIFATHDVAVSPSRYGCKPAFFAEVVRLAVASSARVVPMIQACEELRIAAEPSSHPNTFDGGTQLRQVGMHDGARSQEEKR